MSHDSLVSGRIQIQKKRLNRCFIPIDLQINAILTHSTSLLLLLLLAWPTFLTIYVLFFCGFLMQTKKRKKQTKSLFDLLIVLTEMLVLRAENQNDVYPRSSSANAVLKKKNLITETRHDSNLFVWCPTYRSTIAFTVLFNKFSLIDFLSHRFHCLIVFFALHLFALLSNGRAKNSVSTCNYLFIEFSSTGLVGTA